MKKLVTYLNSGILILFVILAISCSKEETNELNPDNQKSNATAMNKTFANGIHGNEFVSGQLNSLMTNHNGMTNFANNTGNNNFTGSDPGTGTGGGGGNSGTGSFSFGGTTYPIEIGGYENWGEGWFSIYLVEQNAPNGVVFDILSPSIHGIESGTYHYSEQHIPFTFEWAQVVIGNNYYYDFTGGSISISRSANTYSINFIGELDNGDIISGFYLGNLIDLEEEPEPEPISGMSATIGSQTWIADYPIATHDTEFGFLTIGSYGNDGSSLFMELDASMVYEGAQLTLQNDGIFSIHYYNPTGYFSADSYAIVNITFFTSSEVSGTFEFNGIDYNNNTIIVTNGMFSNVAIATQ